MITLSHVVYAIVTVAVIIVMLFRRGVVIPSLIGTFLVGWIYKGDVISGFQAVYNANLTAAKELFTIFLIITFMVALLASLRDIGADRRMIRPIQRLMINGHVAFFVLAIVTYVISLFFWPTPAVPLIGALLFPAAIRVGLPPMAAAMAVALAGQGMALSSDYIMQVAPMLSAKGAGVATGMVADKAMVLSLITGGVSITVAYLMHRKAIRKSETPFNQHESGNIRPVQESTEYAQAAAAVETLPPNILKWSKIFSILVPLSMLAVMAVMAASKFGGTNMGGFEGGDGAAFIGGVAVILLILSCTVFSKIGALDKISDHLTEGFVFAFKAMGPVIPIAGFFFLGNADFSKSILSLGESAAAPAILYDLVMSVQYAIPANGFLTSFGILIIGIIAGLEGSGFSGLPLTGSLSGALGPTVGIDPSTLAAIGQMGSVWSGGGTLIAWSSLVAVAGFAGVSVIELARKNFIPVVLGLSIATIAALFLW
ncbi:MAG: rane protein [Brevibacillus sp.]|nr:rane protein [Brevibacillus sp.]